MSDPRSAIFLAGDGEPILVVSSPDQVVGLIERAAPDDLLALAGVADWGGQERTVYMRAGAVNLISPTVRPES